MSKTLRKSAWISLLSSMIRIFRSDLMITSPYPSLCRQTTACTGGIACLDGCCIRQRELDRERGPAADPFALYRYRSTHFRDRVGRGVQAKTIAMPLRGKAVVEDLLKVLPRDAAAGVRDDN